MSLITIAWSFVSAIGVTVFFVQLVLWRAHKGNLAPLLAATMALSAAGGAICELVMAKAASVRVFEIAILLNNVMVFFLVIPMVWFVRLRLGTGPIWLAGAITVLWIIGLGVNLFLPGDLTFSSIESLQKRPTFWGETFNTPVGTANPFRIVSEVATLLIIMFTGWATIAAFRDGLRFHALRTGGPVLFFILAAGIHTVFVDLGMVGTPYMISWAFMAIAIALGSEIVGDAVSAARLHTQLQQSESRWQALFDNVDLGVIGVSAEGRITFANRSMLSLLGRADCDVVGQPLENFVPPALRGELASRISTARQVGPRARTDYPLLDAEGKSKDVVWSLVAIRDHDETITDFMAICDDVTAARRTENDLNETRRTIEKLDRSAALAEITAGIAHELNQPLAGILSNAQAARRILPNSPTPIKDLAEILDDIIYDNKRARDIIIGLRQLLSPQVGSMCPVAMAAVIEDIRRLLSSEMTTRGISLAIEDMRIVPMVQANKVQIEQVFLNLILNAAHLLMDDGSEEPKIEIRWRVRGKKLAVYVIDNGPGINPAMRKAILQPGVTTRKDGLGMGLTIVKRIIESHGGKIGFTSRADRGTVFRFTVPLSQDEPGEV
ncbi:two-component system sensor histidine kinase NtrB [Roseibium alexandrii]|uniref:histidine kinase n=1 Tax=Roseibium alexandrii (strain DSM 17067 / NCIMB 14079 / DFL-11) TaxID=244592 RepID=A0A5E8H686_ROSAD|nr:ATP-binding protein [Roseibium alexandrii]EEE48033.1 PAS domain S-box [Roseibium alexandrii DFL-11]